MLCILDKRVAQNISGKAYYHRYLCHCGTKFVAVAAKVKIGHTKSCGCLKINLLKKNVTTHGLSTSPEYFTWRNMLNRCKNKTLPRYGGRGIKVCKEWIENFESFYRDMGPRPSKEHSIDRVDNELGYSKENCKWSTLVEQCNNRSSNRYLTFKGQTHNLTEWSKITGIGFSTLRMRLLRNWSIEKTLTKKVK